MASAGVNQDLVVISPLRTSAGNRAGVATSLGDSPATAPDAVGRPSGGAEETSAVKLSDWARMLGVNITTITMRIDKYHWTEEEALMGRRK